MHGGVNYMSRKKGVAKVASNASRRAGKVAKQARKMGPLSKKRSLGSRVARALPGSSGTIAGIAGTMAAGRGAKLLASKLKDKSGGSGSVVEKAVEGVHELLGGEDGASRVKLRDIIQEYIDVSVPAQFAYEHWTNYEDLSDVFKGIEAVREEGSQEIQWTAKIGPSRRQWSSEITDDLERERIEWDSTGGSDNTGIVAFHPLSENLTRIMVQMEYHPRGFVENVGNLLRIQRRRVRRDLRLFKHHVELKVGPPPPAEQSDKDSSSSKSTSRGEGGEGGERPSNKDDSSGNGSTRYEDRTMDELLKRAAELGIEGRSNMNKQQLIEALRK
jgi:uncharacterized membrane protein